jgi:cobaltochelatase CobS
MEKVKKRIKKDDKSYFISDSNLNLLRACIDTNSAALLVGETGTGKTTIIRELAKEQDKMLIRISVNGSMGVEEILGKWLVNKGTTVWQDGILTMALRAGHWVVMDEINAALPEILFVLHSLLDDDRKVILPEKDNEVVIPHSDFRFFATMNPSEEYAGTKDMNKALVSRFTAVIQVETLRNADEMKLLQIKGGEKDICFKLVKLADKLRKYKNKDQIFYFCSTRDLVQTVELMTHGLALADALLGAVVNKMSPKEYEIVDKEFTDILGSTMVFPYESIDEMLEKIKAQDYAIAQQKADYEKKLLEREAEIRKEVGREASDKVRDEILEKLRKAATSSE